MRDLFASAPRRRTLDEAVLAPSALLFAAAALVVLASLAINALPPGAASGSGLGMRWAVWVSFVLIAADLAALSLIDARTRRLPTPLVRPLYVLCPLFALLAGLCRHGDAAVAGWALSAGMGLAMAGFVAAVALLVDRMGTRGRGEGDPSAAGASRPRHAEARSLGMGDVRLIAALGLACGPSLAYVLAGACLLGVAWSAATRKKTFAFGPFLAVPALAVLALSLV